MGILYSQADNEITITGFSALTPCNFTDLWTEDKAGTLELMPAALPAMNMTLKTQIKPSDEIALKIDFILASSGAGAGDTIDITGTDKDGNAQTETLTTTADGTFETTKWFKTITDIDCNGFSSGTLLVRQNQWGVIEKPSDTTFIVSAGIRVGIYPSTLGWFGDINKQIIFKRGGVDNIGFKGGAVGVLTLGEILDADLKTAQNGCLVEVLSDSGINSLINGMLGLNLYGCTIKTDGLRSYMVGSTGNIWQNTLGMNFDSDNDLDLFNNIMTGADSAFKGSNWRVIDIAPDASLFNCNYILRTSSQDVILKDIYARSINTALIQLGLFGSGEVYAVNWDVNWSKGFGWGSFGQKPIYRQYTFNLKVIDKDGNGIGNATVVLSDKDGNTADQKGFSTTTSDADATRGKITEQTVSYGYYSQSTGNTLQSYSPHTLEIKKAGKLTYKKQFTLDEKINWKIKLDPGTTMDLSGNLFKKITPSSIMRL